jgi:hypothetical protein
MDLTLGDSATYRLHPATLGWRYTRWAPGRALCVEFRRDLLSPGGVFSPFSQWAPDPARVAPLASALARALDAGSEPS